MACTTRSACLPLTRDVPEQDEANARRIGELGLETLLFRGTTLESLTSAGWQVAVVNACLGKARPTPTSIVLEGTGIDSLPVAETTLEWCVLLATGQA